MNTPSEHAQAWPKVAAAIPTEAIQWRIDGKPTARDGKFFARYVAYIDAQFVRERLDSTVPGNWDLTLELLPMTDVVGPGGEVKSREFSFKARLQILGVIREDVGSGEDYKSASTDAFKRAAVRFGIGHELYSYEQNWVQVDGEGKYAKPVEDPQTAYERRHGSGAERKGAARASETASGQSGNPNGVATQTAPTSAPPPASLHTDITSCPQCGGKMWDNRLTKRNPKQPDYKCQNRTCNGVIWPPRPNSETRPVATGMARDGEGPEDYPAALLDNDLDLPF